MYSRKFMDFFISKYDLLVPLMASKGGALETIEPAAIPEEKSGPIRPSICIAGMTLGWVLGGCFVLVQNFFGCRSNLAKESNA